MKYKHLVTLYASVLFGIVSTYAQPANNDCDYATSIPIANNTCNQLIAFSTLAATASGGIAPTCNPTGADDDVWFKFIATATEQFIKVTPAHTNGISDVVFEVFSGTTCDNLVFKDCVNKTTDAVAEESLLPGFTIDEYYFVRVYSYSSEPTSMGDFTICIAESNVAITNLLSNPSFEEPVQPNLGNNSPENNIVTNWILSTQANLIKVDGTEYGGGPDTAHHGEQYLDLVGGVGTVDQNFTLSTTATIQFGGWFSRREPTSGTGFDGFVEIRNGGAVEATSSVAHFDGEESNKEWKGVSGTTTLQPGNYIFRFQLHDYANVDDAFVTIVDPSIAAITISADKTTICENEVVTFTATAVNVVGDPVFVWLKNNSPIEQGNSNVYSTPYHDKDVITCQLTSSNPPVTTNPISIPINANCYCIPPYSTFDQTESNLTYGISSITFNGIAHVNNDKPLNGYNDFTQIELPGKQAELSNFTINTYTTNAAFAYCRIWIDFNDDWDFEDAGELVFAQKRNGLYIITGSFFIPKNAPTGTHRIRFRTNSWTVFGSCEKGSPGETEDYSIRITLGDPCNSGTPTIALAKAEQYVLCSGGSTQVTVFANGLGISYQWQKSNEANGSFTDIIGATASTYATGPIIDTTYYKCRLTCNSSGQSISSPVLAIVMGAVPVNDEFCNAIPLSHEVFNYQNTTCATISSVDFPIDDGCSEANNTVWYKITPSVTEMLRLQVDKVTNDPYPIDAWLTIYTASGSCNNPTLTPISSYPYKCLRANLPKDGSVEVVAEHPSGIVQAGTTYYIRVDGFLGSYGAFGIKSLTTTTAIVWNGATNNEWGNLANWNGRIVPGPTSDVIISGNMARYPIISSDVTIKSLTLNPGASFTLGDDYRLTVTGL